MVDVAEIFSEKEAVYIRSKRLNIPIMIYVQILHSSGSDVQKEELRKEIIATAQQIGMENCTISCRAAFFMLKHCPWLLKAAISVYMPLSGLVLRMVGR